MCLNEQQYLETDVESAIRELEQYLLNKRRELYHDGWFYYTTDLAPESYGELVERSADHIIPIANYGCDKTIFSAPGYNHIMRFWHDVLHLRLNADFSYEGEVRVAIHHIEEAKAAGLSTLALKILAADTLGQVEYYRVHKGFVDNQKAFMYSCLRLGRKYAVNVKH